MSRAATTVFVYGVYLIFLGVTLIVTPNTLLGILGIPPTTEVYIRILGAVVLGIALYYVAAARQDVVPFFRWTVWGRALVLACLIVFVALKLAPAVLLIFSVIEALGATWTWLRLRASPSGAA